MKEINEVPVGEVEEFPVMKLEVTKRALTAIKASVAVPGRSKSRMTLSSTVRGISLKISRVSGTGYYKRTVYDSIVIPNAAVPYLTEALVAMAAAKEEAE